MIGIVGIYERLCIIVILVMCCIELATLVLIVCCQ